MLNVKRVTSDMKDIVLVEKLMDSAFPSSERVPFPYLLITGEPEVDFLAFYDKDVFCALAWIFNWRDLSFLFYLAVDDDMRGKGYGSDVLSYIKEVKKGRRIVLDIEPVDANAKNYEQRVRRMKFYRENGFQETGVSYFWQGAEFDLLINEGTVTNTEVAELYQHIGESWKKTTF